MSAILMSKIKPTGWETYGREQVPSWSAGTKHLSLSSQAQTFSEWFPKLGEKGNGCVSMLYERCGGLGVRLEIWGIIIGLVKTVIK